MSLFDSNIFDSSIFDTGPTVDGGEGGGTPPVVTLPFKRISHQFRVEGRFPVAINGGPTSYFSEGGIYVLSEAELATLEDANVRLESVLIPGPPTGRYIIDAEKHGLQIKLAINGVTTTLPTGRALELDALTLEVLRNSNIEYTAELAQGTTPDGVVLPVEPESELGLTYLLDRMSLVITNRLSQPIQGNA